VVLAAPLARSRFEFDTGLHYYTTLKSPASTRGRFPLNLYLLRAIEEFPKTRDAPSASLVFVSFRELRESCLKELHGERYVRPEVLLTPAQPRPVSPD
jgi:hypothetical protein